MKVGVSRLRNSDTALGGFRRALRELAVIVGVEATRDPDLKVFLAALEDKLNDKAYMVSGIGDAGDRYFGT